MLKTPAITNNIPIVEFFIINFYCKINYNVISYFYHPHGQKVAHLHELKVG